MTTVLDKKQIANEIEKIKNSIIESLSDSSDVAVIGVRSRGEIIAQRLAKILSESLKKEIPQGVLDITLYRDDLNQAGAYSQPKVRTTEIGFNIDNKVIILVDDVLYTGRSTRAALDALIDLGRPKQIKLAVLVERPGREFPIQADYVGEKVNVDPEEHVQVNLVESDGKDEVIIT